MVAPATAGAEMRKDMGTYSPGTAGCVKVVMRLNPAKAFTNLANLQNALSAHVAGSPYANNSSVSDLKMANSVLFFTVNGQCNFYLHELENIVVSLGGDVESSDGNQQPKS